jgi:hypothetical protein
MDLNENQKNEVTTKTWKPIPQDLEAFIDKKSEDGLFLLCICGTSLKLPQKDSYNSGLFVLRAHIKSRAHIAFMEMKNGERRIQQKKITSYFAAPSENKEHSTIPIDNSLGICKSANLILATERRFLHTTKVGTLSGTQNSCPGLFPNGFLDAKGSAAILAVQKYTDMLAGCKVETQKYGQVVCVRSVRCTGKGAVPRRSPKTSQGCDECFKLYSNSTNFTTRVRDRGEKYEFLESVLNRIATEGGALTASERQRCENALHEPAESRAMNSNRDNLLLSLRNALCFVDHIQKMRILKLGTADSFVKSFVAVYSEHKELRESVLLGFVKAMVVLLEKRRHNPVYLEKTLGFCSVLRGISSSAYNFFRANIMGPSIRHLRRNASRKHESCILDIDDELLEKRLNDFIDLVHEAGVQQGVLEAADKVRFSISIDGTKVPRRREVSTISNSIVGYVFPFHSLSFDSPLDAEYELASEIKCAVVCLQDKIEGVSPIFVWAGCPESDKIRNRKFNEKVVHIASSTRNGTFLAVATDGISTDARFIQIHVRKYIKGEESFAALLDPNHNAKNLRNRLLSGNSVIRAGFGIFDPGLLVRSGVAAHIVEIHDWASDKAVLELCSSETIVKIKEVATDDDLSNLVVTVSSLVFMRAYLFAVNAKFCGTENERLQRSAMLFGSLIWFTEIHGIHKTTIKNLICSVLPLSLLLVDDNVRCGRYLTTEPAEHVFGILRSMEREFTIASCLRLVEKLRIKLQNMVDFDLKSANSSRGYQAGLDEFISARQAYGHNRNNDVTWKKRKIEVSARKDTAKLVEIFSSSTFSSYGIVARMRKFCTIIQKSARRRSLFLTVRFKTSADLVDLLNSSLINSESHQVDGLDRVDADSIQETEVSETSHREKDLKSLSNLSCDLEMALNLDIENSGGKPCTYISEKENHPLDAAVNNGSIESFFTFLDKAAYFSNNLDSKLEDFLDAAIEFCTNAKTNADSSKYGTGDTTRKFKTLQERIKHRENLPRSAFIHDIGDIAYINNVCSRVLCCFLFKNGRFVPCSLNTWNNDMGKRRKQHLGNLASGHRQNDKAEEKVRLLLQLVEKDELLCRYKVVQESWENSKNPVHFIVEVSMEDIHWVDMKSHHSKLEN